MKKIIVATYETTQHKLTVTPTEIRMKFRQGSDSEERTKVETFFAEVADAMEGVQCSFRGNIDLGENYMSMYPNSGENAITFRISEAL